MFEVRCLHKIPDHIYDYIEEVDSPPGYMLKEGIAFVLPPYVSNYGLIVNGLSKLDGDTLYVVRGAWYDGASSVAITGRSNLLASLVHDMLYGFSAVNRKEADRVYYDMCRIGGMCWVRAKYHYLGLRLFGGWYRRK